ncbi:hypothetical protein Tco_0990794 [Tanacetum coccineum]|uniref:Uncharacterized protein n=1 Tax=Tanacetum coccineum TaxID=301880 RepID=A0ABQ5EYK8_9ASTR
MSKPRFASQVDVNNNLSRPITQHYLPKRRESTFAKPDHMIASSLSRNSSKNMPRFSLNDMVHNYYLEEARKKTQERNKNSKSSVMHTVSPQNTTKGHRFSSNKISVVYEKTSPRSYLRWKPTGRIFKSVGLRWIPTGKTFDSCTGKVDGELTHGSNVDIPNIHVCKQTLNLSAELIMPRLIKVCEGWEQAHTTKSPMMEPCLDAWYFTKSQDQVKVHHPNVTEVLRNSENTIPSYGINLDNVHLSECGSEAAFYEFKSLALKHSEKPR